MITAGAKALSAALASVTALVIARGLQAEGNGVFVSVMVVALLMAPLAQVAARVVVVAVLSNHPVLTGPEVLRTARNLLAVCGILSVTIGGGVVAWLADEEARGLSYAALALLPGIGMMSYAHARWWVREEAAAPDLQTLLQSSLRFALVLGFAATDRLSVGTALACVLAATYVAAIAGLLHSQDTKPSTAIPHRTYPLLLRVAIPAVLTNLLLGGLLRVDILMLNWYAVSKAEVGSYGIAARLLEVAWMAPLAFGQVFFVREGRAKRSAQTANRASGKLLLTNVLGSFALGAALTGAVALVGSFWLGNSFADVGTLMALSLPGIATYAAIPLARSTLFLEDRFIAVALATGTGLLANLGLNAALIPHFNARGAAAATSLSYAIVAAILVAAMRHPREGASNIA